MFPGKWFARFWLRGTSPRSTPAGPARRTDTPDRGRPARFSTPAVAMERAGRPRSQCPASQPLPLLWGGRDARGPSVPLLNPRRCYGAGGTPAVPVSRFTTPAVAMGRAGRPRSQCPASLPPPLPWGGRDARGPSPASLPPPAMGRAGRPRSGTTAIPPCLDLT